MHRCFRAGHEMHAVCRQQAQVTPRVLMDAQDVIFMSKEAVFKPPKAIRWAHACEDPAAGKPKEAPLLRSSMPHSSASAQPSAVRALYAPQGWRAGVLPAVWPAGAAGPARLCAQLGIRGRRRHRQQRYAGARPRRAQDPRAVQRPVSHRNKQACIGLLSPSLYGLIGSGVSALPPHYERLAPTHTHTHKHTRTSTPAHRCSRPLARRTSASPTPLSCAWR